MRGNPLQFFLVLLSSSIATCYFCGFPGRPAFCVSAVGDHYEVGETVEYRCRDGYLFQSIVDQHQATRIQRECLANSTWSGSLPTCYENFLMTKAIAHIDRIKGVLIGRTTTLNIGVVFADSVQLQANSSVEICGGFAKQQLGDHQANETVFCQECNSTLQSSWNLLEITCQELDRQFAVHKWSELRLFVELLANGTSNQSLSYSSISLTLHKEHSLCGEPEKPANGDSKRLNATLVQYWCNANYRLTGDQYRYCIDGKWDGYQRICLEESKLPEKSEGLSGTQIALVVATILAVIFVAILIYLLRRRYRLRWSTKQWVTVASSRGSKSPQRKVILYDDATNTKRDATDSAANKRRTNVTENIYETINYEEVA